MMMMFQAVNVYICIFNGGDYFNFVSYYRIQKKQKDIYKIKFILIRKCLIIIIQKYHVEIFNYIAICWLILTFSLSLTLYHFKEIKVRAERNNQSKHAQYALLLYLKLNIM